MPKANFGKIVVQFFKKILKFTFFEIGTAQLHTAPHRYAPTVRRTLHCSSPYRAHAARSTRVTSAGYFMLVAKPTSEKMKFRILRKN